MKILKLLAALSLSSILISCASTPPVQQPVQFNSVDSYGLYRSPLMDQTNHTMQHLNESKDIVYYQTYGGGGVGVGLLGPFGVMANIKMIESNTMEHVAVLEGKLAVDPKAVFMATAEKNKVIVNEGPDAAFKLNPYLLVENTEGDVLMLASVVLVEHQGAEGKMQSKYVVQLPVTYTLDELANLDAEGSANLNDLVADGYSTLLARMAAESAVNAETEQKIKVTSEFLTPRFKFKMGGNLIEETNDYVWVRLIGSVCGVRKADISYQKI